jgi:hypothetical protein
MVIPKMGGHPPTHFFPSLDSAELKRANKGEQGFSLLPTSVKLPAVTLPDEHVTRAAMNRWQWIEVLSIRKFIPIYRVSGGVRIPQASLFVYCQARSMKKIRQEYPSL